MSVILVKLIAYIGAPVKPKSVRSHVNLCSSEFNTFHVEKEAAINFSLKPLRTAIHFADVFNLPIALNFEKGGWYVHMLLFINSSYNWYSINIDICNSKN